MKTEANTSRATQLCEFVCSMESRTLPGGVIEAAQKALLDFLGVSIAGRDDDAVKPLRRVVERWRAEGAARIFLGPTTTPSLAALVNATMTHAMDLDDVHHLGGGHPSGPCWSAALAIAQDRGLDERSAVAAFVAGYEVMARLGGGGQSGVGRSLQHRGFHPTSVFGRAGAACAAAVLLRLDRRQVGSALGVAATTAGGLVGSFGTHSKPFHAGKAAMDGVLAAEMAADGFVAASDLYELNKGILPSFLNGVAANVPVLDFGEQWYILENGFKRYASCRATHASAEAAVEIAPRLNVDDIESIDAFVNPIALVAAGNLDPRTGLEGRFSVPFCIALALHGYRLSAFDFNQSVVEHPGIAALVKKIRCHAVPGQSEVQAKLEIRLADGSAMESFVDAVRGHPRKPMEWSDLEEKFLSLSEPMLGMTTARELFTIAREFGESKGAIARISNLLAA
jgi:2-methylcitrate dehydratase PrpD